jgi:hypothetical protein
MVMTQRKERTKIFMATALLKAAAKAGKRLPGGPSLSKGGLQAAVKEGKRARKRKNAKKMAQAGIRTGIEAASLAQSMTKGLRKRMNQENGGQGIPAIGASTQSLSKRFKVLQGRRGGDSIRMVGKERLGSLTLTSNAVEGTMLFNLAISPVTIGSRLIQYSGLYERYRFSKLRILYVPNISQANVLANGAIIMGVEHDPTDPLPPTNVFGMNEMFAWAQSEDNSVFADGVIDVTFPDASASYYVNDNGESDRFSIQCRFLVGASTALTAGTYGRFFLEYDIDMFHAVPHALNHLSGGFIWNSTGSGATITDPFGVSNLDPSTYGVTYDHATGTFTFNDPGQYVVCGYFTGTGLSALTLGGTATRSGANQSSFGATIGLFQLAVMVTAANQTLIMNLATATTITASLARFARAPDNSLALARAPEHSTKALELKISSLESRLQPECCPCDF